LQELAPFGVTEVQWYGGCGSSRLASDQPTERLLQSARKPLIIRRPEKRAFTAKCLMGQRIGRILVPPFPGSNPGAPANDFSTLYRPSLKQEALVRKTKKLRSIIVDGEPYPWRFSPGCERTGCELEPYRCRDIFTAYRKGQKRSPLRIVFSTWESPVIGGPLRVGAPLDLGAQGEPDAHGANLHTPGFASRLIARARRLGWEPASRMPFVVSDGLPLLRGVISDLKPDTRTIQIS
jgi:hypothetical protein